MTCTNTIHCERCGDCLECYWEDPCFDGGEHQWPTLPLQAESPPFAAEGSK